MTALLRIIYNLAIHAYWFLVHVASLWNRKAQKLVEGTREVVSLKSSEDRVKIWIHVSSLGEFEQGRPLIDLLKAYYPDIVIVLTFFSPSGYEIRKKYPNVDHVQYIPKDTPQLASRFLDEISPSLIIFVKYDFWLNHLLGAFRRNIPLFFISARFTGKELYFGLAKNLYVPIFQQVAHWFVQDDASQKVLNNHHINRTTVCGDTRVDRVLNMMNRAGRFPLIEQFTEGHKVMIMGSIWPSDRRYFEQIMETKNDWKFILAPHLVDEQHIRKLQESFNRVLRYSEFSEKYTDQQILIIDNIGMLAQIYRYADYVYVGGGAKGTLHNLLEPAVYGVPVFFAGHPNNDKFFESRMLVKTGGGFSLDSGEELIRLIDELESDKSKYDASCAASSSFIQSQQGATDTIMKHISSCLK
jgi:3-deoxy-D-manno-octulosonic-acid transferase